MIAPPPPPLPEAAVRDACRSLEAARGREAHLEALLVLGAGVLGGDLALADDDVHDDPTADWPDVLRDVASEIRHVGGNSRRTKASFPPPGQFGKAVETQVVSSVIQAAVAQAADVVSSRATQGPVLDGQVTEMRRAVASRSHLSTPHPFLPLLDARLSEIRLYHARHGTNEHLSARRLAADGFDLGARAWLRPLADEDGSLYRTPEVWGKYLDLERTEWMRTLQVLQEKGDATTSHTNNSFVYLDFLQVLGQGLDKLDAAAKLTHRKLYERFLVQLQDYLLDFLQRTSPLLDAHQEILAPALRTVDAGTTPPAADAPLDLAAFDSAAALQKAVNPDALKAELGRLGLKCGGTPVDRAKRLWLTKDKEPADWPAKIRAKQTLPTSSSTSSGKEVGTATPAAVSISLVQREALVTALLDQVRPSLEATAKRMERQQGQTLSEREKEIQEDLHGSTVQAKKRKVADGYEDDDEDDEDDAPIYNPKNVPLDWDGKPIPYWLFKLHGLNHVSTIRNVRCVCTMFGWQWISLFLMFMMCDSIIRVRFAREKPIEDGAILNCISEIKSTRLG
jgi:hypothetical protein